MRGVTDEAKKTECVRLRVEGRKSLREIHKDTGVPKGTLSGWLKPYPLTDDERKERQRANLAANRHQGPLKDKGEPSKFHHVSAGQQMSRLQKAKVAEAAVMFRLVLHGFNVFGSVFDGDKTDWLVEVPGTNSAVKVQVKWAGHHPQGLPSIRLGCVEGHNKQRPYKEGEFDFLVGYDLYTDTAYVWSWGEVQRYTRSVTVAPEAAERWDKMRT